MGYFGFRPYVPVATRRKQAAAAAAKAAKGGHKYQPIESFQGAIAKSFWGTAWCANLEHYSDYANRLPRGRTYVRNGSVIDLQVQAGEVRALVFGSSLYKVKVSVNALPKTRWQAVCKSCSGSIDSLVGLLQGKLSPAVMTHVCAPRTGLFPAPKEIEFDCSCPDWAGMCKHVAAVLYGVGVRLDQQPELLFTLRQVDAKEIVAQASVPLGKPAPAKRLDDDDLGALFGLDMGTQVMPPLSSPQTTRKKATAAKSSKPQSAAVVPAKKKAVVKRLAAKMAVADASKTSAAAALNAAQKTRALFPFEWNLTSQPMDGDAC